MSGGPRLLGVVLAGGASSRFGSPKWRAPLAGSPMGGRAVAALAPHAERVVALSADPEVAAVLGVETRPDLEPGLGPLGGLSTALAWAEEFALDGALVLAADLPLVSERVVGLLVSSWGGEQAVAFRGADGPEPLCALYGAGLRVEVERTLATGGRSPAALLERADVRWLEVDAARAASGTPDPFLNVNTPDELALAERLLGAAGRRSPPGPPPAPGRSGLRDPVRTTPASSSGGGEPRKPPKNGGSTE